MINGKLFSINKLLRIIDNRIIIDAIIWIIK